MAVMCWTCETEICLSYVLNLWTWDNTICAEVNLNMCWDIWIWIWIRIWICIRISIWIWTECWKWTWPKHCWTLKRPRTTTSWNQFQRKKLIFKTDGLLKGSGPNNNWTIKWPRAKKLTKKKIWTVKGQGPENKSPNYSIWPNLADQN